MFITILQFLLYLTGSSSAAVLPPLDLAGYSVALNASNTPTNEPLIDPRFSLTGHYLEPILNVEPYLMTCLSVIASTTVYHPQQRINPMKYLNPRVPGISITTSATTAGGTIEARFITWGLFAASSIAMTDEIFQGIRYKLKWDGVDVGYLEITKSEAQLSLPGSNTTQSITQRFYNLPHPDQTTYKRENLQNITLTDPAYPRLSIDISLKPEHLTIYEFIGTCLSGLLNIARFPTGQEAMPFWIQPPTPYSHGTMIGMIGAGADGRNPNFKYAHVGIAIVSLAHYQQSRGTFREAVVTVSLEPSRGGTLVRIGTGSIWKPTSTL